MNSSYFRATKGNRMRPNKKVELKEDYHLKFKTSKKNNLLDKLLKKNRMMILLCYQKNKKIKVHPLLSIHRPHHLIHHHLINQTLLPLHHLRILIQVKIKKGKI